MIKKDLNKLRIYYDFQILHLQKYGGISRYFYELISSMEKQKLAEPSIDCLYNTNYYFKDKVYNTMLFKKEPPKGGSFLNRQLALWKLGKGYDIVHPTYYDPYILKAKKGKIVITIYDMIHEIYPEYFNTDDNTVAYKKQMIFGADHIITISQKTKEDIISLYPDIDSDKISVIYLASNFKKCTIVDKDRLRIPKRYILFVGRRDKYKNFNTFYLGLTELLKEDKDLYLVCAGGGELNSDEKNLIKENRDKVIQIDVNDDILSVLYSNAICFVFPSLYEGFGIPTLEAFACDCPVVLSDTSSMPEVGGKAVVYINPESISDIKTKVSEVVNNPVLRNQLVEQGRKQLSKFSWDKTTRETIECYNKVLVNSAKSRERKF